VSDTLVLVLALVAMICGAILVFRSRGGDLSGWGLMALAFISIIPRL
jgi:preprotein translocase subunit SecG